MPRKERYQPAIPKQLSSGDKDFIKRIEAGEKKAPAFRAAYPEHPAVKAWLAAEPRTPERQKAAEAVIYSAKSKLQSKYMRNAIMSYQDAMEQYSELSLETAIDLVQNARSEKVRADLAIEGIRHKIGTPVQKVAIQEQKTVTISFGAPAPIEGELVSPQSTGDALPGPADSH